MRDKIGNLANILKGTEGEIKTPSLNKEITAWVRLSL